ncbi:MAG: hypothetical protein M3Y39_21990 [Chloroflexota bacterium]|nr:hypothetical protein [Chloroflexota bacterium]
MAPPALLVKRAAVQDATPRQGAVPPPGEHLVPVSGPPALHVQGGPYTTCNGADIDASPHLYDG